MKRFLSFLVTLTLAATVAAQIIPATGPVRGPASATDSGVAVFDGTTGKLLKNSVGVTYTADATLSFGTTADKATIAGDASGGLVVTPKAGQGVGVGTAPIGTVVFSTKGSTTNDSAFAFLARNSADTNLFYIRNDGFVNLPTTGGFQTAGNLTASGTGTHTFGTGGNTVTLAAGAVTATGIPEYADNAAAVSAGKPVGFFYRTGDVLKVVH